ncbi:MAG: Hpt domain-containing protein [Ruminiclostridium sp.]|nr:Hpt domain-containing protein [Ruminiclostridium sp.]
MELMGSEKLLLNVIEQYYRSIDKNIAKMNASYENGNTELLTIEFHSLKSTSKQIGANKLSQMAKDLEMAGKDNNNIYIRDNIEKFLDEYKAMKNVLSAYFGNKDNEKPEKQDIKPQLDELSNALSDMDALQIDDVLEKISQNTSASDKTYFDGIKTAVDDCDFDKAESILSEWNSTLQS